MHNQIAGDTDFRRRWACLVAGRRPDVRTRFEAGRIDCTEHELRYRGRALVATLQKLTWEKTIFRRPCWQLYLALPPCDLAGLRAVAEEVRSPGITWTRVASEHVRAIETLRATCFEPLLEMTNLEMPLVRWRPLATDTDIQIRLATPRDAAAVGRIAARMFSQDRFHVDPKIAARLADKAHRVWAHNAVLGKAADQTIVSVNDGRISGFHALKWLETPQGRVGLTVLIGIAATQRGRGIGKALLVAGLSALQRGAARQAWVRTESANTVATQLYQAAGFHPRSRFWYLRRFNV
jgi:ribosomal protein S18 acetylase RimI-like enzyme